MTEHVIDTAQLPESRLYTFIDEGREFALYFLEGQRLIYDLALVHPIHGAGFAYFRDVVLSIQPMIAFLKTGEQFGFYIDSEAPFFRLKIETGHHGQTRCMLLPEEFSQFPPAMRGMVRLQKLFPGNRPPYQSVLEVEGLPLGEIVNHVLEESYQVNSRVIVSQTSDQSALLHQLPPLKGKEEYEYSMAAVRAQRASMLYEMGDIFGRGLRDAGRIESAFSDIGFRLIAARPVVFRCSCSRERMIQNLQPIYRQHPGELFDPGQPGLEVICEYCKSRYDIFRTELHDAPSPLH